MQCRLSDVGLWHVSVSFACSNSSADADLLGLFKDIRSDGKLEVD